MNIRQGQGVGGGESAGDFFECRATVTQLPETRGRAVDHMRAAVAPIVQNGFLTDTLKRNLGATNWDDTIHSVSHPMSELSRDICATQSWSAANERRKTILLRTTIRISITKKVATRSNNFFIHSSHCAAFHVESCY